MIKGAQKQMIVIRTGNSPYFDEAYFVLRRGVRPEKREKPDILSEADRILRESGTVRTSGKRKITRWLVFLAFLAGLAIGAAVHFLILS